LLHNYFLSFNTCHLTFCFDLDLHAFRLKGDSAAIILDGVKIVQIQYINFLGLCYVMNADAMISIVYGSPAAGSGNKRAALIGGLGRHLRPIFANWLY
jgi:hypothetical protein